MVVATCIIATQIAEAAVAFERPVVLPVPLLVVEGQSGMPQPAVDPLEIAQAEPLLLGPPVLAQAHPAIRVGEARAGPITEDIVVTGRARPAIRYRR